MSTEHIVPVRTYLVIFSLLMVLTALTTWVAFVDLGVMNVVIMLLIAFTKAAVVVLWFMHVKFSPPLTKVVAASGFAWLSILIALTLSDVLTRNILP